MNAKGSYNQITLVGNFGQDPELKSLPSGTSVVNFNIATTTAWKDANNQQQERTEWHRCVAYDKLAELIGNRGRKGLKVLIAGPVNHRSYDDQNGQKKYITEVKIETFQFLESLTRAGKEEVGENQEIPAGAPNVDDLPF